ncbi:hypothetical protein KL86PLE_40091 [uncultured Pleomorphomonas sp.]|uniref:Uncharacterized protein n=1 Tax=uncultured Pleomorphomonas sp. TaxID=442121 RepID=A0A212LFF9_9HYPH|nr:hypothetical protein KL86PLE_40091 [uncultured Pleomorphomonas sp.]
MLRWGKEFYDYSKIQIQMGGLYCARPSGGDEGSGPGGGRDDVIRRHRARADHRQG